MMALLGRISELLPRSRFARSVSILAGGTAAGQLLVVAAAPLLTRLYGPEDFGLLAAFVALLAILGVLSSLRYEFAIPLPASDLEAAHVVGLCLAVLAGTAVISAVLVLLFAGSIAQALHMPALARYLWLLPLGLVLAGIYEVLTYWAIRGRAFPSIAKTKLFQVVAMVAVQLGGFLLGPLALLLGQVAGNAAGATAMGGFVARRSRTLFSQVRLAGVWRMAVRYRRFPIYSTWSSAFNTFSSQVPPLLFAALFSPVVAGLYALAQRVLATPMSMVGQAVSDVFFSDAADARREGALTALVGKIYERLAQIAMPPALVLALVGPQLFAHVFGAQWQQAGEFAQWMAPWLFLQFVGSPLSLVFDVLERQVEEMICQLAMLSVRVAALLLGYWIGDLTTTVALFALGSALCYLAKIHWIFHVTQNEWGILWRTSGRAFVWSALLVSPLALAVGFEVSAEVWLGTAALVAMLLGARYVVLFRAAW